MTLILPHAGIVLLVGPSGSGKSTLINRLIKNGDITSSEAVSSDHFRMLVSDGAFFNWTGHAPEEADVLKTHYQQISAEAFCMMDSLIETRARLNRLTIIDATHLYSDDRLKYIQFAKKHHLPITALVLDVKEATLLDRDASREDPRGKKRIKQQFQVFKREKRSLKREGFHRVHFMSEEDMDNILFSRSSNPVEIDAGSGIDVIGDIHGCYEEMLELLQQLGYEKNHEDLYVHPEGRIFLSLGDVMSRGPRSLDTMIFFKRHVQAELAYMIDSNHGWKIARWLDGRKVILNHGDEKVEEELKQFAVKNGEHAAAELKAELRELLLSAPSHYVVKKNNVPLMVCTHAGIKDHYIGKQSGRISDFCRYGDTDGVDAEGRPVRKDWFIKHQGAELIVWGHDPKPEPIIMHRTLNIDQGAVFGGKLTAFRFPEKSIVSVPAKADYANTENNPLKRWKEKRLAPPNIGKYIHGYSVLTEDFGEVKIDETLVKPAIDTVSHFTIPMEQLIYIPPTMSPTPEASVLPDYMEHPQEAIDYYKSKDIHTLIAEKKHMGSRAIILLFSDRQASIEKTGIDSLGVIYTRTGRRFFDKEMEARMLAKLHADLTASDYFRKKETEFLLLDAEILPWNLKAKDLISKQYAHVAEAAFMDRSRLAEKLGEAAMNNEELTIWHKAYKMKLDNAQNFQDVFQQYCWDVSNESEIQIAPFHLLAYSNRSFLAKTHVWHMEQISELAKCSSMLKETDYMVITDDTSADEVIRWWQQMTEDGHEGIVIKPETFTAKSKGKLLQPAIKVRGRKYLSIIYGMDYLEEQHLTRLKNRRTGKKQKLALQEFALSTESIRRFVNGESLERVHECVLASLALESDRVDPRL